MNQGLFESLTGHFSDGTPLDVVGSRQRMVRSIMDHLNRLFNTRAGSVPHLPDYGLPDISSIYRKMPDGIDELVTAIRRCVERYEPRLLRLGIVRKEEKGPLLRLVFILSGELRGGVPVRFQTTFFNTGNSSITPWKKTD